MRKLMFITIVCAFVAVPAFAVPYAQYLGYGAYRNYNGYVAGEYYLKTWGLPDVNPDGVQFTSFCIEFHEPISKGLYDAEISTEAIAGNGGSGDGPTGGDLLSPASAWLYDGYLSGALSGYHPGDIGLAIWYLEDEIPENNYTAGQTTLINLAQASGWTDTGPYRVLNLYAYGTAPNHQGYPENYRQDFIVKVPVPAAVLLGMLGLSVAGLKLRKYA